MLLELIWINILYYNYDNSYLIEVEVVEEVGGVRRVCTVIGNICLAFIPG